MSALSKLMDARREFHSRFIKKTGWNDYSKYEYFQLADFLVPAMDIFHALKLASLTTFTHEMATMAITDLEDGSSVQITSPMSSASLKAAHEIQNLGAVQTYLRRYLWVAALEIVEHDGFDDKKPERKKGVHRPTDGAVVDPKRLPVLKKVAEAMLESYRRDDIAGAYEESEGVTDAEERLALWDILKPHSACRSAVKAYKESLKEQQ